MRTYIIRRLLAIIPTLLVLSFLVFFLVRMLPGNITDALMAGSQGDDLDMSRVEKELGLDAPLVVQYLRWMGFYPRDDGRLSGVLQGNFGVSWWQRIPVLELVAHKWPVTLELGLIALFVAQLVAFPVGIISAVRQDTWADFAGRSFAILAISVPGFWLGTMVIVLPGIWWGYMPPISLTTFADDPIGNLKMFLVPGILLGLAMSGLTMRMTRTMMLEVLRQDYVRTAWAKGLREKVVVMRHALKNALIPVVTIVGLYMPVLIGGTVIFERIFSLPGMGRLMVDAIIQRDQPIVAGVILLFSGALMLLNLIVDLTYGLLDPRVRH
jgi:peptide/nickel transport system permease protein